VLEAVRDHETDREISSVSTCPTCSTSPTRSPTGPPAGATELDGLVDTSMLDTLFDAETLAEIVEESEEEVQSLKAALGG
jgi:hypothetical protein